MAIVALVFQIRGAVATECLGKDLAPISAAGKTMKFVGYFTNWAQYRTGPCKFDPSYINGNLYSHINFAFAKTNPQTFAVEPIEWNDVTSSGVQGNYDKVNSLKRTWPHLRTIISIGGWNAGAAVFSQMAETAENRAKFIQSAIQFARTYGFDGVDIDWEYPADTAQGGRAIDTINFSNLMQEFRAAINAESSAFPYVAVLIL
jgi:GH18 family chitinase